MRGAIRSVGVHIGVGCSVLIRFELGMSRSSVLCRATLRTKGMAGSLIALFVILDPQQSVCFGKSLLGISQVHITSRSKPATKFPRIVSWGWKEKFSIGFCVFLLQKQANVSWWLKELVSVNDKIPLSEVRPNCSWWFYR